ncbi:MAG: hypothetical protein AAFZ15_26485 [Bacteroidota bacterium]
MINNQLINGIKFLCILLFIYCLPSCKGIKKAERLGDKISYEDTSVQLNQSPKDSITLHYTGCSGFLIKYKDQAVLHDPFFSNLSIGKIFFRKNKLDTCRINRFFKSYFPTGKDESGLIQLLLISHTHYDHMLDAPYIYHNILDTNHVKMMGSDNMFRIMDNLSNKEIDTSRIISVEKKLSNCSETGLNYRSQNSKILVWPIEYRHAAHFYCVHLFKGKNKNKYPKRGCKWKGGKSLAFLIDFLDERDSIKFRMFIAGSSSNAPNGYIPEQLKKRPIDLAVISVASHAYVNNYPNCLLNDLKPKHLVLSHWENFFQPPEELKKKGMVVSLTSAKKFFKKLGNVKYEGKNNPYFTMPNIETKMTFHF